LDNIKIIEFSTENTTYIYNDDTGLTFPKKDIDKLKEIINLLKHNNMKEKPVLREVDIQHFLLYEGFTQLILSVTENCNFRCKYCYYYSGMYDYAPIFNRKNMNFDIAKKAVDYYFNNIFQVLKYNPYRKPCVTFYGGEPLLNFDLIKSIVTYIRKKFPNINVLYNITTNGYLLTKDIVDFLIDNDFYIAVSLDGYKENHDRNRTTIKGQKTFDKILQNLEYIRFHYPRYFYENISLICCYDWKTDLFKLEEFFSTNKNLPPLVRVNAAAPYFSKYYQIFTKEDFLNHQCQIQKLKDVYFEQIKKKKKTSAFLDIFFGSNYRTLLIREKITKSKGVFNFLHGSCVPGVKIFIDTDGNFHICEKVNYSFPIGNIEEGLNYKKIIQVLNKYKEEITYECKKCPISRLCTMCFATFMTNNRFSKDPENICELLIKQTLSDFSELYSLLESDPSFEEKLFHLNTKNKRRNYEHIL
jgi:uncharacterized protein